VDAQQPGGRLRRKDGTPAQEWVDWDPGADANTNCHSQTVSVTYEGVGLAVDKQHCEMWDIDKGAEAADMSNWWRGTSAERSARRPP